MDGGILTMPVRVGIGGAHMLLRTAEAAAGCAVRVGGKATVAAAQAASRVSDTVVWGRPTPTLESVPEPAATDVSDVQPAPPAPPRSVNGDLSETFQPRPVAPPEPPRPPEPIHVSEEPELVEEFAEPGAEDGAGAAVTVDEPWPGCTRMTAKQVIERLTDASPAELATVLLYESFNRDRQTVRAAAERHLKSKTGRGSPD
jgi:hypothetical protein